MDVDLRHLRYARELATHESFSVAAKTLGISQPALSRAIRRLEDNIGARLFDRARGGVFPTDAGTLLLSRAQPLLAQADGLTRELSRLGSLELSTVSLGAGPYAADLLAGDVIGRIVSSASGIALQLRIEQYTELARLVRDRELDVAIAEGSTVREADDLVGTPLTPVQGYFAVRAGHPLTRRRSISLSDVLAWPFAMSGRIPPRILEPLLAALPEDAPARQESGKASFPAITCPAPRVIAEVLLASEAVGALTPSMAEAAVESGRMELLDLELPWLRTNFTILQRSDARTSRVREKVVDAIRAADRELARKESRAIRRIFGRRTA
jgi:DNA-binding transcriptional LysR family regulator